MTSMTALKTETRKLDVCTAAGQDSMPVLHVSGLMRDTAGDGGADKGSKVLLTFMQVCANDDLTPCIARCFGTAKYVSILKNAASGVAGEWRPLAVARFFVDRRPFSYSKRRHRSQQTNFCHIKSPHFPPLVRTFLCMNSTRSGSSLGTIRSRLR
jgi:hypothetical protein